MGVVFYVLVYIGGAGSDTRSGGGGVLSVGWGGFGDKKSRGKFFPDFFVQKSAHSTEASIASTYTLYTFYSGYSTCSVLPRTWKSVIVLYGRKE